jgi:predicted nucleic acid-binding protein
MDAMPSSRSTPATTDREPDFDVIADELYALAPADFAAARDTYVRTARADGRQSLARELAQLRRPTLSAWLINLLWRDQREVVQQLFELANELRRAQAQAAGAALRTLTAQRRQLEVALLRRANELADQHGVNLTDAVAREAQETLSAALASPEVADEVRTGRLVKPASYAGFGVLPAARPVAAPPPRAARTEAAAEPDELQARAAQRAREKREAAERRVEEARSVAAAAAATLAERDRDLQAAKSHHQEVRDRLEELQAQVRELQREIAAAGQAEVVAARHHDEADKAHTAARQALERAEADLARLGS